MFLADGEWKVFTENRRYSQREKRVWLDKMQDVALGSDAFFPFGDNIERAHKTARKVYRAPGGSVRDDNVIDVYSKILESAMAFHHGIRLFHQNLLGNLPYVLDDRNYMRLLKYTAAKICRRGGMARRIRLKI